MLKDIGVFRETGRISIETRTKLVSLIERFEEKLIAKSPHLAPKIIRSKLAGSIYAIVDPEKVVLIYAPTAFCEFIANEESVVIEAAEAIKQLSLEKDIDDISLAIFPRITLDGSHLLTDQLIDNAASDHINQQIEVYRMTQRVSSFSPIFGPNSFPVQDNLVFVLMPFESKLTSIYNEIVKEAIETDCQMKCRRADDIISTNAIMLDIWKSICEARLIIADLTNFNANVMYELGIAHTIGKPMLILYQDTKNKSKFPFDLAHIRRINYSNTATGGKKLRLEVTKTIRAMLEFTQTNNFESELR